MITEDLVPLANANAHQLTVKGVKQDWLIRENISDQELATLNARISDEDMFAILHFARKYELAALNAGIAFQKDKQNKALNEQIARLLGERAAMIEHNEQLAVTVDRLTRGEN